MASSHLYILPIVVFLWFNSTFLITFAIAVLLGHVNPVFPYISDTGTFSPESCIFGQLVNIGTLLFGCVVYVRWRQAAELCAVYELGARLERLNTSAAVVGLSSCLGINFVANFQETAVFSMHLVCAMLGFGCGTAWILLQTAISYKLYPLASASLWLLRFRTAISCITLLTYFICIVCGALAFLSFRGKTIADMAQWHREDGGWELHLASTLCEWCTALLAMAYVLTLSGEFRRVWLHRPVVHVEAAGLLAEDTDVAGTAALPA